MVIDWGFKSDFAQLVLHQDATAWTWSGGTASGPPPATGEQGAYYYSMYPQIVVFGIGLGILFHLLSISL
ncbi:hypothetical protein LCGC14_1862890 [marine sediment metagenome]|uniref:Uncharacterized protein n=1 Tax=marine sediment metagenome TaxID=412755 RepID=A0A0F9G7D1_9ZZZZ